MTDFSSILLSALQETINDSIKYAEELGETFGEVAINIRAVSREPTKRLKQNFECMLCAATSSVEEKRHDFLVTFARDAHSKELNSEQAAPTGWHNSYIAHERVVFSQAGGRDYSVLACVLFQNTEHNQQICDRLIRDLESMAK